MWTSFGFISPHYWTPLFIPINESPHQYLSNELLCALNEDYIKNLGHREVDVLTYPNGAHMTFGASFPRVMFLDVYGFAFMIIVKMNSKPHCTHLLVNERSCQMSLKDMVPPF
jgi:hypothetical protein